MFSASFLFCFTGIKSNEESEGDQYWYARVVFYSSLGESVVPDVTMDECCVVEGFGVQVAQGAEALWSLSASRATQRDSTPPAACSVWDKNHIQGRKGCINRPEIMTFDTQDTMPDASSCHNICLRRSHTTTQQSRTQMTLHSVGRWRNTGVPCYHSVNFRTKTELLRSVTDPPIPHEHTFLPLEKTLDKSIYWGMRAKQRPSSIHADTSPSVQLLLATI